MNGFLCIAAIAAFVAAPSAAVNCKNNKCTQRGAVQTLCKYTNPQPSPACGSVFSTGFSQDEKNRMVNKHNELRQYIANGLESKGKPGPQPPAKNMLHMLWDDELADVAQRWANQCNFGHDQCRDVDRYGVGQNVAMIMYTGQPNAKPEDIVMMWYEEVKNMDRNTVNNLQSASNVGHYTQLVWATSNRLGCGKIVHKKDKWNRYYVVCNYGPSGNWIGQPVYEV